jgi:hypothetical protein
MIAICRRSNLRGKNHQVNKVRPNKAIFQGFSNRMSPVYALTAVNGFLVLTGIIIRGGLLPNMNKCASPVAQTSSSSLPPVLGLIHGYVGGPTGVPAVDAALVAAEQQTG